MFMVEGHREGFESIPQSVYWAVVTVTTVGYGDVSPGTPLGKFLSVLLMLAGYSIIAVPTGIVTAEMRNKRQEIGKMCDRCGNNDIDDDSRFCMTGFYYIQQIQSITIGQTNVEQNNIVFIDR